MGKAFNENVFKVRIGNKIKGTCKFYIAEYFGKQIGK